MLNADALNNDSARPTRFAPLRLILPLQEVLDQAHETVVQAALFALPMSSISSAMCSRSTSDARPDRSNSALCRVHSAKSVS
jgi:hypothetical protein